MSITEQMRIPPEVNRILFIRNLPLKISADELYDVFGKFGPIRRIQRGIAPDTKGSAYVVYDDIYDAKNALESLNGINVGGKYLIVHYFHREKMLRRIELRKAKREVENLKKNTN